MVFDRPESGTVALLVHLEIDREEGERLEEFNELALSAGLNPVACITGRRRTPDSRTFVGKGKVEEIREAREREDASLVLVDHDLTPTQERNLEAELDCRVLGRTGLILQIFAQRARTHEGKLQVELAQLRHLATRLVRGWSHLDRQRGGAGRRSGVAIGLGGAGETQLEADQRMIGQRIKSINLRLGKVRRQRLQSRRSRMRAETRTLSLVGYTNAGKSTLFNRLCDADVDVADQLFATLDPTLRKLEIPVFGTVVLADTVGFIRHLPHTLIDSFRATLEEVKESSLLLHVVDSASDERDSNTEQVNSVLGEIGAHRVRQLFVYNKTDMTGEKARVDRDENGLPHRVWVSARENLGLDLLLDAIREVLTEAVAKTRITLDPSLGQLRAELYNTGAVVEERMTDDGRMELIVRLEEEKLQAVLARSRATPKSKIQVDRAS